ncbi:hypothetical protein, partial [Pontiella sp.]|uniref:hypothetical protein n=1 Tax=Pontiella sp. TaxID=2837462 RepID=UPI0035683E84
MFLSAAAVQAQLTWDVVPGLAGVGDSAIAHSNGVWDTTTANWTSDAGANNQTWGFGEEAVFTSNTNNAQIVIDVDAGVTVGDLTLETPDTSGNVILRGLADNTQLSVDAGGATWSLGGRYLELLANTSQDLFLSMTSGDTLTVVSGGAAGGTFDTGEKPTGAAWLVDGCTLDFQATNSTLKGNSASVGAFDTVIMADGSSYVHDRNGNQGYVNDWDVGTGTVTFKNRWGNNGNVTINGDVSGSGTIVINCNATRFWKPNNTNNTFLGKYIIGQDNIAGSELQNYAGDLAFGPVPTNAVPDYFTLKNSGEMKLQNFEIHANRGITLDGIGVIINNGGPTVYGGTITGDGQLQVGRNDGFDGNVLYLYSDTHDYTGGTRIWQGSLTLGIDNALPNDGVLTIGGGAKNGYFRMNGFDQTIGGLTLGGGNTKEVVNNGTNDVTLTIDVAEGESYAYNANFNGSNQVHIVKNGLGGQSFSKTGYSTAPGSLTVNAGTLTWSSTVGPSGLTTINSGSTLAGTGTFSADVEVKSGARITPGNGSGWNSLKFETTLDLSDMIDDNTGGLEIGFGAAKDSIIATNIASSGTIDMDGAGPFDLGFADFTFTHDPAYQLESGTYPILMADTILGNLDPTDLSGDVGNYGATGTLSLSNNTVYLIVEGADTSAYGLWASENGVSEDGPEGDSDADGYNNFQEFAYGGNPTNAGDIGYAPTAGLFDDGSTNWLTLVSGYRSDTNSGVTYDYLTSGSLTIPAWTNAGITVLGTG